MSIKRKIELLLQEIRQATHYSKQNHVDKAWTLIGQLQEPATLNPMNEVPEDDRTVLIAVAGKRGKTLFSPGYFDACWWAVRFNWGDEDAWPMEDHLPEALGWIEAPTVEIEDEH